MVVLSLCLTDFNVLFAGIAKIEQPKPNKNIKNNSLLIL